MYFKILILASLFSANTYCNNNIPIKELGSYIEKHKIEMEGKDEGIHFKGIDSQYKVATKTLKLKPNIEVENNKGEKETIKAEVNLYFTN